MPAKIEISHKTILFTLVILILLWLVLQIREIIFLVYVSLILMSAFKPLAELLERIYIPRVISVFFIYILIIALAVFLGSTIIPPVVTQTIHLGERMPDYISTIAPMLQFDPQILTQQITPLGENLVKVTIGIFSNIITLFTVLVISFYFLIERQQLDKYLSSLLGKGISGKIVSALSGIEDKLGAWVRGQLLLAITIWLFVFLGLSILDLPYVLALSVFAGIMEIVPIIGPIIAAIPAILVALTISPVTALLTVLLYFTIQQLEAHIIVPIVMKKAVGLPPVISIIALMVGAELGGIVGALLAVPLVITLEVIISEYLKSKDKAY